MKNSAFKIYSFLSAVLFVLPTFSQSKPESTVEQKQKNYAGGRDEEELKVQESLTSPTLTVDRRTIEQKVLKNYFKKADEEGSSQPTRQ